MIIARTEQTVNQDSQPDLAFYRQRAAATKARRQAAGRYARPTKAQAAAFATSMKRDGRKLLTTDELAQLATHPYLLPSQKAEYAAMHQAAIAKALESKVAA